MTKRQWKRKISEHMDALRIDAKAYDAVVDSLAAILEQRDRTREEFEDDGGRSVIEYTNKGGSTNTVKNPLLVLWSDLNTSALAYWRELGMTPSSYRKMMGEAAQKQKELRPSLAAALMDLEG